MALKRKRQGDDEGLDAAAGSSSWDLAERMYALHIESNERIAALESRMDHVEDLLATAGDNSADIKMTVSEMKAELAELTRVRRDHADLASKLKYDIIRWAVVGILAILAAVFGLGIKAWLEKGTL